jgi:hypothetical protein
MAVPEGPARQTETLEGRTWTTHHHRLLTVGLPLDAGQGEWMPEPTLLPPVAAESLQC